MQWSDLTERASTGASVHATLSVLHFLHCAACYTGSTPLKNLLTVRTVHPSGVFPR